MTANTALGDFLRSRRERLVPPEVNGTHRPRRTPGLKREEVAAAAGISAEWYVKLEQGRTVAPSPTTIDALARALRLGEAEHAHLRRLARGEHHEPFLREVVPEPIRRMVAEVAWPAYVTGRRWDLLACNVGATKLLFGFEAIMAEDRNLLLLMLTDPYVRDVFGNHWCEEARSMIAHFRTTYDLWVGDPAFENLVTRLRAASSEFSTLWQDHEVRGPASLEKELNTTSGKCRFVTTHFQANDDPTLRLTIFMPLP